MNIFQKSWNQIFSRNKSTSKDKLSPDQCRAAEAVFGISVPKDVKDQCSVIDNARVVKSAYKQAKQFDATKRLIAITQELKQDMAERQRERELDRAERVFFPSTKVSHGANYYNDNSTTQDNQSDDWTSAMVRAGKKLPEPTSENVYSRHDIKMGKLRNQYRTP